MTLSENRDTVVIREVRPDDLTAIAAIERASFSDAWTPAMLAAHLGGGVDVFLTAEAAGEVVGFAVAYVVAGEAELLDIAVRPDRRGGGIGALVLAEVCARCAARGAAMMTLEVRESNAAALALYSRHGFVPAGRRRRYYREPTEDAIVMQLNFPVGAGDPALSR